MGRVTTRRPIVRVRDGVVNRRPDTLAVEEPLEIRLGSRPLTITMRTPGDDFDLAQGFLVSEGVIHGPQDVLGVRYCAGATEEGLNTYNVLEVDLAPHVPVPDSSIERNFYTTSSCGVCGKASLEALETTAKWDVAADDVRISTDVLTSLPDTLRSAQQVFDKTGGLHATGLFTAAGELVTLREDVGRHNAMDKVIGHALRTDRLPLREHVLMVSGRTSFELAQKAVTAGVPVLAGVSAPSSLAVELAREFGLTLVGFLRGQSMNVYAGEDRITGLDGG